MLQLVICSMLCKEIYISILIPKMAGDQELLATIVIFKIPFSKAFARRYASSAIKILGFHAMRKVML